MTSPAYRAPKGAGTIYEASGKWYWRRSGVDSNGIRRYWTEAAFDTKEAAEFARAAAVKPLSVDWSAETWGGWFRKYLPRRLGDLRGRAPMSGPGVMRLWVV